METTCYLNINIFRLRREHSNEQDHQLTDKLEYDLRSCPAEEWARVFPGRVDDRNTFTYANEQKKITLNNPASPWGANGIPATRPRIEVYENTEFGRDETLIVSDNRSYPCLELARTEMAMISDGTVPYVLAAKQLAPALGIRGTWDEPAFHKNGLRWKPSEIEYAMLNKPTDRMLLPVKDYDGCIRHLIEFRQGPDMVLPLSFAQDATDYCAPMPCSFSFEKSWYLVNSEYLAVFKNAEVIITGELGVVLGNKPDEHTIVLGYAFGYEMIADLKLDGLKYRNITLLLLETPEKCQFIENIKEIVALLSRFYDLDIPVNIEYTKCEYSDDTTFRRRCEVFGKYADLNFLNEKYSAPHSISKDDLVKMAMGLQIYIPDNIRLDRLGRIPDCNQTPLIDGLIDAGSTSVLLAHDGVDVSLVCGSIVAGMQKLMSAIFPEHWKSINYCRLVVLTAAGTQAGIEKAVSGLHAKMCQFYTLPSGTKEEIEQRLSAIRHETGANIFIFSGSQILAEHKTMLESACVWAQKTGTGILICTGLKSGSAVQDFLDETCKRQFHVLRLCSNDLAYLVKENDPFSETPQIFKIVLTHGSWTTEDLTANDLKKVEELLPVSPNYDGQPLYQENENEKKLKELI